MDSLERSSRYKQTSTPLSEAVEVATSAAHWYIISIVACLVVGFLIYQSTERRYTSESIILLKEDMGGEGITSGVAMFADMGVGSGISSVDNEVILLKSSKLMRQVAERLNLFTTYKISPQLRRVDLYGLSPIKIDWVLPPHDEDFVLTIELVDEGQYHLTSSLGHNRAAKFGEEIRVEDVIFRVEPTKFAEGEHSTESIEVRYTSPDIYLEDIMERLEIGRIDRFTGGVRLSIVDNSAARARDILRELIKVYDEEVIANKNRTAQATESFIADRVAMIYDQLGGVDGRLEEIKRESRLVDFESVTYSAMQQQSMYQQQRESLELQIKLINSIRSQIGDGEYSQIGVNQTLVDFGFADELALYNSLVRRYHTLRDNSGGNNPVLLRAREEVDMLKSSINIALSTLLDNLLLSRTELEELQGDMSGYISTLPHTEKVVRDVMREQSIKEQLYLYLLNKREANALQLAIAESNAMIIEEPQQSRKSSYPSLPIVLLLSMIIGVLIPSLVLFFRAVVDSKIYTKRDIEAGCDIPVVGVIPSKLPEQRGRDIIVAESSRDVISESFRVVRSSLDFYTLDNDDKCATTIQLTSTLSGEGKTYTAINLALSYAYSSKKVLLMDLDLRRANLSRMFPNRSSKGGLSSYLRGRSDSKEDIIERSEICEGVDIIRVGGVPPNAVSLLTSARFRELITFLRSRYDYIIIDSAPYFAVADSQIINPIANITIWVIRAGRVDKKLLDELERMREGGKVENMTILLTDANLKNRGCGYGYGYGYGQDEKTDE